jgi:uncharacterized membrane protein
VEARGWIDPPGPGPKRGGSLANGTLGVNQRTGQGVSARGVAESAGQSGLEPRPAPSASTPHAAQPRLDFIDVHRGLAVVLMIWMHSADAWLRPVLKTGLRWDDPWNLIRSAGGLAAPIFLLLAGTSCGIGLWRAAARTGASPGAVARDAAAVSDEAREQVARGLQLVVLGYALRLQMWLVDAGGARLTSGWLATLALGLGYLWAFQALGRAGRREASAALAGRSALSLVVGFWIASGIAQPSASALVRVDVLQAIGASLAIAAALHRPLLRVPWLGVVLGALVAFATHHVREWVPGVLPVPVAAYLAQWPPLPGRSYASLFPLFPWLGYALAGVSLGQWLASAAAHGREQRAAVIAALIGIPLAVLACEPLPMAKALVAAAPESLQLVRVVYRIGASLILLGLALVLARPAMPFSSSLRALGQASLFVYWAHLQLTFGILAKPLARALELASWGFGFALLTVAMALIAPHWLALRRRVGVRSANASRGAPAAGQPERAGA